MQFSCFSSGTTSFAAIVPFPWSFSNSLLDLNDACGWGCRDVNPRANGTKDKLDSQDRNRTLKALVSH